MSSSIKVYLESKKAHTTFNETHKKFKLLNPIRIKSLEERILELENKYRIKSIPIYENIFHFNQNKISFY
tara:strand:+ start:1198 stop:1407 length:210 start_codon:yes stop_codon:yes gene_type:complete